MGGWIAVALVVGFFGVGIYLLSRNRRLADKVGRSETREEIYREAAEKAKEAQALRARPRRTPQQLMDRLRKRAGDRPRGTPLSKP